MSLMQQIHQGRRHSPPRLLIYGTEGIGKSTTAAGAPNPIFIPTEDGLDQIDCASFPLAQKLADVDAALQSLINPADNFGGRTDLPRASYLRADLVLLGQCDALALLSGWRGSLGAKLEYMIARELAMPILDAQTLQPFDLLPEAAVMLNTSEDGESILDEAKRITATVRHGDYGHPADDFARTARMWSGILANKLRAGEQVTAIDVPLCMIAVKLARQAHRHKRDNLVDIAGYARTAAMAAGVE